MIEIKNLMFQPLTLHLAGDGGGLHLKPREVRKLGREYLSPEMEAAEKRGFISIKREAVEDASGAIEQAAGANKAKPKKTRKKRS